MALYHFSAQMISRSTGRSATAAAAYRSGQEIADQRTGQVHDYSRKGGVVHCEVFAPDGAPSWVCDRSALWNAVEVAEKRKDAQLAREIEISLPRELNREDQVNLVSGFVQENFVSRGMVADVAIHDIKARDGERQPHAHVMLTTRQLGPNGFGGKARDWNDRAVLDQWREGWAGHVNLALERAGYAQRVDHRSLAAQRAEALEVANDNARPELERAQATEHAAQLDREPLPTLSVAVIEMERRGVRTDKGDELREVRARNAERASLRQQLTEVAARLVEFTRMAATKLGHMANKVLESASLKAPTGETEARRIEQMSAAELRAEIEKTRPPPIDEVMSKRSDIVDAANRTWELSADRDNARRRFTLVQQEILDWRQQHATGAAVHDKGLWKSAELSALEVKAIEAQGLAQATEQMLKDQERTEAIKWEQARAEVHEFQRPARGHVAQLEAALKLKDAAERALDTARREFEALASKLRINDRNADKHREAAPKPLRDAVDTYNRIPNPDPYGPLSARRAFVERLDGSLLLKAMKQYRERAHAMGLEKTRGIQR